MVITERCSQQIAKELNIAARQINNTALLLQEGGTVPFIARYRKEQTGSLDEVQVAAIRDGIDRYVELEKRKKSILSSLAERQLLEPDLQGKIEAAGSLSHLEDIYLPFRPKKQTRGGKARERGLEPLARLILQGGNVHEAASQFVNPAAGIETAEEALDGARDIIAEQISESLAVRKRLRQLFHHDSIITSRVIEKRKSEAAKFTDYFDWQEPVKDIAGHRLLALFRGESLELLKLTLQPDAQKGLAVVRQVYAKKIKGNQQLQMAIEDSYQRLLAPSLENALRKELKARCDTEAIEVFARNLRDLLLAPPLGQKRVMALDPGYRTGAKLVCLDERGGLLHSTTVFPTQGGEQAQRAAERIKSLVSEYDIEAIAIGDGTAGRETERFVRSLELDRAPLITLVNEDGASVYSASESARREFANKDITVRGAISIGRRLQDPLAELVKIDPKSIGVGQYQHDVNQQQLKKGLSEVVISCVNKVGVEVNSASVELLSYVAGLGPVLAQNIVEYRSTKGGITSRKELLKVKRLGQKAFEQCAGFIRVRGAANPLDNSGVHPERYELVEKIAADNGMSVNTLLGSRKVQEKIQIVNYRDDTVGIETLTDIMAELAKPGRDPRAQFSQFQFNAQISSIEDLQEGMILPAIITNVTKFGAFADVGIKQDGLIHISQMARHFVKDPATVVSVRQQLQVKVLEVDLKRERISLSLLL